MKRKVEVPSITIEQHDGTVMCSLGPQGPEGFAFTTTMTLAGDGGERHWEGRSLDLLDETIWQYVWAALDQYEARFGEVVPV